jgi:hypothetical protein
VGKLKPTLTLSLIFLIAKPKYASSNSEEDPGLMAFSVIIERCIEKSPISTMVRALLERTLTQERLEACFETATEKQYTRELLFTSLFELMSLVVTKTFPSINAAYQVKKEEIGVSITSVYNKLNGLETEVSAHLVRDTARELSATIQALKGSCAPLLPGYRVKMLDGNCLATSERRLKVLRGRYSGPLPGKSLVVYDPALEMAVDVFPCEDGHAQERSLLNRVICTIHCNDVMIMDRNFCVRSFLFEINGRDALFICRHHKQTPYEELSELVSCGRSDTGDISEQWVQFKNEDGTKSRWRRIVVKLKSKTRDGDTELVLITNLQKGVADAKKIAELYRKRWSIETMFQQLESYLNSEIETLGYPKAALFGFCVAIIAYNVMAVVKAALRSIHGEEKIANDVSGYYIAGEIGRTREGMMLIVPEEDWNQFATLSFHAFLTVMLRMAANVKLDKYKKHKRGPKKEAPEKISTPNEPHVSTAKLLDADKKSP